jgi:hypothetical protein
MRAKGPLPFTLVTGRGRGWRVRLRKPSANGPVPPLAWKAVKGAGIVRELANAWEGPVRNSIYIVEWTLMLRRILPFLTAICFAVPCLAASIKPLYVSWIPATSSLVAGSKPSIRITLSDTPTTAMDVSISASDSAVSLPGATVPAVIGSRYITFPVAFLGVDGNTNVAVTASANGTSVTSPTMTIVAASLLRVTFNTTPVSNVVTGDQQNVELKITMTGPVGPSGFLVQGAIQHGSLALSDFLSFRGAFSSVDNVSLDAGETIHRVTFNVPAMSTSGTVLANFTGIPIGVPDIINLPSFVVTVNAG